MQYTIYSVYKVRTLHGFEVGEREESYGVQSDYDSGRI